MFDLPVKEKTERREYRRFQQALREEGFMRLQYSVYVRYMKSEEASTALRRRLRARLPPGGQVRLLAVTDRQFGKMEIHEGRKRLQPESAPEQLLLF